MTLRPAPHIHRKMSSPSIYLHVLVALIPPCVAAVFFYGIRAIVIILWSALLFLVSDRIISVLIHKDTHYYDISSIISGIMIALMLPANISMLHVFVGVIFASVFAKQVYGGAGTNLFNPALIGRAFIEVIYRVRDYDVVMPGKERWVLNTLLSASSENLSAQTGTHFSDLTEWMMGSVPGFMGASAVLLIFFGGVYLMLYGVIRPHEPMAVILAFSIVYIGVTGGRTESVGLIHALTESGVVFVAVFAVNDYATSPIDTRFRFIAALLIGIFTAVIYLLVQPIFSLLLPVLLMNLMTPIADFYSRSKLFAQGKEVRGHKMTGENGARAEEVGQ